ncbi:MAG: alpha-hydroxy-acid oxidizing protein [Eisenbergiella sp.]
MFKALALGADAVCVGRAWGICRQRCGRRTEKIASLTEELAGIMARTGASDLSQIDPSVIWKA